MKNHNLMPAKESVSLFRQTIYCFIPLVDLYAAYNVKKLRWYLLIMLGLGVVFSVVGEIANPTEWTEESILNVDGGQIDLENEMFGENSETGMTLFFINTGVTYVVAVYFIRKWSKKWNEQFRSTSDTFGV